MRVRGEAAALLRCCWVGGWGLGSPQPRSSTQHWGLVGQASSPTDSDKGECAADAESREAGDALVFDAKVREHTDRWVLSSRGVKERRHLCVFHKLTS